MSSLFFDRLSATLLSKAVRRPEGIGISRGNLEKWISENGFRPSSRFIDSCFWDPRISSLKLGLGFYDIDAAKHVAEFCGVASGTVDWQGMFNDVRDKLGDNFLAVDVLSIAPAPLVQAVPAPIPGPIVAGAAGPAVHVPPPVAPMVPAEINRETVSQMTKEDLEALVLSQHRQICRLTGRLARALATKESYYKTIERKKDQLCTAKEKMISLETRRRNLSRRFFKANNLAT
jgi:hypothetical protein